MFDTGIQRQLTQSLATNLVIGSGEYGKLFEQMIICECFKLNDYFETDFKFYFLRTKSGAEIDLIVKKPGNKKILIEIKSSNKILSHNEKHLVALSENIKHEEKWIVCTEKETRMTDTGVRILPWALALNILFNKEINT